MAQSKSSSSGDGLDSYEMVDKPSSSTMAKKLDASTSEGQLKGADHRLAGGGDQPEEGSDRINAIHSEANFHFNMNLSDSPEHQSSPPAGSGFQLNQNNVMDYVVDQWSRSIVIDDVSDSYVDMLEMLLEDASEGGGKVLSFQRQGRTVLATFEDSNVAENFLDRKKLQILKQTMTVSRAPLVETEMESILYFSQFNSRASYSEDGSIDVRTKGEVERNVQSQARPSAERSVGRDGVHGSDRTSATNPTQRASSDTRTIGINPDPMAMNTNNSNSEGLPVKVTCPEVEGDRSSDRVKEDMVAANGKDFVEKKSPADVQPTVPPDLLPANRPDADNLQPTAADPLPTNQTDNVQPATSANFQPVSTKLDKLHEAPKGSETKNSSVSNDDDYQDAVSNGSCEDDASASVSAKPAEEMSRHGSVETTNSELHPSKPENVPAIETTVANDGDIKMDTSVSSAEANCSAVPESRVDGRNDSESDVTLSEYRLYVHNIDEETADVFCKLIKGRNRGYGPINGTTFDNETLTICFGNEKGYEFAQKKRAVKLMDEVYKFSSSPTPQEMDDVTSTLTDLCESLSFGSSAGSNADVSMRSSDNEPADSKSPDSDSSKCQKKPGTSEEKQIHPVLKGSSLSDDEGPSRKQPKLTISKYQQQEELDQSNERFEKEKSPEMEIDEEDQCKRAASRGEEISQDVPPSVDLSRTSFSSEPAACEDKEALNMTKTIEISNLPTDIQEESLRMILENRRYTGKANARIEELRLDIGNGRTRVTYTESGVAEALIAKGFIRFKDQEWIISRPEMLKKVESPNEDYQRTSERQKDDVEKSKIEKMIELSNLPTDILEENLRMILENKRYIGQVNGSVEEICQNFEKCRAIVTYTEPTVAEALIAKGFIRFKNQEWIISRPAMPKKVESPNEDHQRTSEGQEDDVEKSKLEKMIELSNLPTDILEENLRMILENKRYTGQVNASVEEIYQNFEKCRAIVTYTERTVAEALIAKGFIRFKDQEWVISRPEVDSFNEGQQRAPEMQGNDERSKLERMIELSNLPVDILEETLRMILENKRYTGVVNASIEEIRPNFERGRAIVTYTKRTVAEALIAKGFIQFKNDKWVVSQAPKHVDVEKDVLLNTHRPTYSENTEVEKKTEQRSEEKQSDDEETLKLETVIEISNLPADIALDNLQMILESKRYVGVSNALVEEIIPNFENCRAIVTYTEARVAEALIAKGFVEFKARKLIISRPSSSKNDKDIEDTNADKVEVWDIPLKLNQEFLVIFFENNARSGGGDIKECTFNDAKRRAIIQFVNPNVARALLVKKIVDFKGAQMRILAVQSTSNSQNKFQGAGQDHDSTTEQSVPPGTILVENIPVSMKKDSLVMLFENKKRSGGGKIFRTDFNDGDVKATITYENPADADNAIAKKTVDFQKNILQIRKPSQLTGIVKPPSASHSSDSQEPGTFDTIKVTPISKTDESTVVMYFENERRSGGGPVAYSKIFADKKKAFIRFEDPKVAMRVICQKLHKIGQLTLKVVAREMPPSVACQAVQVTGINKEKHTKDLISLHFENPKRSAGGQVEDIFLDYPRSLAVITFVDQQSARNVVQKKPQVLIDCPLTITLLSPAPPPPIILEEVDSTRLLAKHLPDTSQFESFKLFLEKESKAVLNTWTRCVKQTTFLLDFHQSPDYYGLRSLVCRKPYEGKMISIQRIPKTTKIQVHGIKENITEDYLRLYFENKRVHGGGDVINVDLRKDVKCAIVEFEKNSVLSDVLSKPHSLEGQLVQVKPYYTWMGLSSEDTPSSIIPSRVKVEFKETQALAFIVEHVDLLKEIQNELEKCNCTAKFPKKGGMIVEFVAKDQTRPVTGWDAYGKAVIQRYLDDLKVRRINIEPKMWNEWKSELSVYEKGEKMQIAIEHNDDKCVTAYLGLTKVADEFEQIVTGIKLNLEKSRATISETVSLKPHQIEILSLCKFWDHLQSEVKGMNIRVGCEDVTFTGTSEFNGKAKVKMFEKLNQVISENLQTTEARLRCLNKPETKAQVDASFRIENLIVSWNVGDRVGKVFALNLDDLKKAVRVIASQVAEQSVILNGSTEHLLTSDKWKDFVKNLSSEFRTLQISELADDTGVSVICLASCSVKVVEKVNAFFEGNTLVNETVPMEAGYYDLIRRYMAEDLAKISIKLKKAGGILKTASETELNPVFHISGTAPAVNVAKTELLELASRIFPADHEIERMSEFFEQQQGRDALAGLEKKYRVNIQIDSSSSSAETKDEPTVDHSIRIKAPLGNGRYILLIEGDITKYGADAVIIAVNEHLSPVGELAKFICEAADQEMKHECKTYNIEKGPFLAGHVYVSKPRGLPYRFIIHAVCSRYRNGDHNEYEKLRQVIFSSLEEAGKLNITSILLPATYAELFIYPAGIAGDIILSTIRDCFNSSAVTSLKEVHIIDVDPAALFSFEKELKKLSDDVAATERPKKSRRGTVHADTASDNAASMSAALGSSFSPTSIPNVISTKEGIRITLFKGSIVTLKVGAIVNTVNLKVDLTHGAVSKTILKTAGKDIQDECTKNLPNGFRHGDIIVTRGYKLPCDFVYHGSVKAWDGASGESEKIIRKFLRNIFEQADSSKLTSVAIPAVGTGNLSVPHDLVANFMYDEVEVFSRKCPNTTLRDIQFVIYDRDQNGIDAFETKLRSLLSSPSQGAAGGQPHSANFGSIADNSQAAGAQGGARPKLPSRASFSRQKHVLQIYALDAAVIKKVIDEIQMILRDSVKDTILESKEDSEAIKKLTDKQIEDIKKLGHGSSLITIDVERKKHVNRIRVRCPATDTGSILQQIYQIFREVDQDTYKHDEEEFVKKMVHWMYEDKGQWEPYPDEINVIIERAYSSNQPIAEWSESKQKFKVTFSKMVEDCGDVKNTVKVKRSTKELTPPHWAEMKDLETCKVVELAPTDQEYQDVEKNVRASDSGTVNTIVKIVRIQNRCLYRQYIVKKEDMEKSNLSSNQIEKILWHGTDAGTVDKINGTIFNRNFGGKNATVYGRGSYFAVNFSYSAQRTYSPPDGNGVKHVYQCKVLVGEHTVGQQDMLTAPNKPAPAVGVYDSVVDNIAAPTMFVVFFDTQAYPEYLIYFK